MHKPLPIAIGYCHPGTVRAEFMASVCGVLQRYKVASRLGVQSGPLIAAGRNKVVKGFLEETDAEYLWMVDTDMVFEPYVIEDLLECNKPVVSALCYAMHDTGVTFPACFTWEKGELINGFPAPKEDPVVEIGGAGAACILIRRNVLEDVGEKFSDRHHRWFEETINPRTNKPIGEDVTFCLRAQEAGHSVWLHTGCKVGHVKTRIV